MVLWTCWGLILWLCQEKQSVNILNQFLFCLLHKLDLICLLRVCVCGGGEGGMRERELITGLHRENRRGWWTALQVFHLNSVERLLQLVVALVGILHVRVLSYCRCWHQTHIHQLPCSRHMYRLLVFDLYTVRFLTSCCWPFFYCTVAVCLPMCKWLVVCAF